MENKPFLAAGQLKHDDRGLYTSLTTPNHLQETGGNTLDSPRKIWRTKSKYLQPKKEHAPSASIVLAKKVFETIELEQKQAFQKQNLEIYKKDPAKHLKSIKVAKSTLLPTIDNIRRSTESGSNRINNGAKNLKINVKGISTDKIGGITSSTKDGNTIKEPKIKKSGYINKI